MWKKIKGRFISQETNKTFVKVRMLKTVWLFRGRKGYEQNDLLLLMKNINVRRDETIYTNEFLVTIIDAFWSLHQTQIILTNFIPFLLYAFFCIIYFPLLLTEYH